MNRLWLFVVGVISLAIVVVVGVGHAVKAGDPAMVFNTVWVMATAFVIGFALGGMWAEDRAGSMPRPFMNNNSIPDLTGLLLKKIKLLAAMKEVDLLAKACDCEAARKRLEELEAEERELMKELWDARIRNAEEWLEEVSHGG